jgi:hypothetical protein
MAIVSPRLAAVCALLASAVWVSVWLHDYWTFPLGSYDETFESRRDTFPVQFLACVLMSMGLVVLAVLRRRAGAGEGAMLLVLASGTLVGSLWGPVWLWPAMAWALFGAWLWWLARRPAQAVGAAV